MKKIILLNAALALAVISITYADVTTNPSAGIRVLASLREIHIEECSFQEGKLLDILEHSRFLEKVRLSVSLIRTEPRKHIAFQYSGGNALDFLIKIAAENALTIRVSSIGILIMPKDLSGTGDYNVLQIGAE